MSVVLQRYDMGGKHKIYIDSKHIYIDTDLFSPPIAKRLKRQNAKLLESDVNVSLILTQLIADK